MSLIFYALNIRKLAIHPETKIHNQKDRNSEMSRNIGKNQLFQKISPSTSHGFSFHPWCPTQYLDLCRGHRVEPGLNEAIQPGFHKIQASNGWFQWDFSIENGDLLVILYILWYWFYGIHELKHIENGDLMGFIKHIGDGDLMGFSAGWNVEVRGDME